MNRQAVLLFLLLPLLFFTSTAFAQDTEQKDLMDVAKHILKVHPADTASKPSRNIEYSGLPGAGYALSTGFAAVLFANAAFTPRQDSNTNISNVLGIVTYTQYKQFYVPVQANLWTPGNKYNIVLDWRFMMYPCFTYGLGGHTQLSDAYTISFNNIHLHQKILRSVAKDLYVGAGYALDYFWDVEEVNPIKHPTDFQRYGLKDNVWASAPTLNAIYDSRRNSVNPEKGFYVSAIYRDNLKAFGSDDNWQSLQLDMRAYLKLSHNSPNVLALWSYNAFTLGGTPPYLLLPSTGSDTYGNSGRGYIQYRYRGRNFLYFESEYRFNITRNGLFGAVVFANAQTVSEQTTNKFEVVAPGYGGGLRFKLNKHSRTNLAIDYGMGIGGSRGFFVNLGEVF